MSSVRQTRPAKLRPRRLESMDTECTGFTVRGPGGRLFATALYSTGLHAFTQGTGEVRLVVWVWACVCVCVCVGGGVVGVWFGFGVWVCICVCVCVGGEVGEGGVAERGSAPT